MTDNQETARDAALEPSQRAREFAWQARPAAFAGTDKERWMAGVYDNQRIIQAFARFERETLKRHAPDVVWPAMRPMEAWAEYEHRDDMVLLLVEFEENATEDEGVALTIGSNTDHNHPAEPEGWKMAGWSWCHDCFTAGEGKPLGWMPLPHHLAREQSSQQPPALHGSMEKDFKREYGCGHSSLAPDAPLTIDTPPGTTTKPDQALVRELYAVARALREEVEPFEVRAPDLHMTSILAQRICREAAEALAAHRERQQ